MHESFLVYARFRYLKLALILLAIGIVAYALHKPIDPPNGGTWLGYTLGGIGAALILWLTWFGVRKRGYWSRLGTIQGWLSAHVYLGVSLLLIATLHTGFQFGWNVHMLAYVLMVLVILSGVFGAYTYARYPTLMTRNRGGITDDDIVVRVEKGGGGMSRDEMLQELGELEEEILDLSKQFDPEIHQVILRDIEHTEIGGGVWRQLTATKPRRRKSPAAEGMEKFISDRLVRTADANETRRLRKLLELIGRRRVALERLRKDIRYQALMEIWLYAHVPLTFALLAALTVHVITVFFYW